MRSCGRYFTRSSRATIGRLANEPMLARRRRGGTLSWKTLLLMLVVLLGCLPSSADAEEEVWRERPHHFSFFVAGTHHEGEDAWTLGLDYEYRVNALIGLGLIGEHAFEDVDSTTLLAVADIHVWRGLAIQTGFGVEFVNEEEEEEEHERKEKEVEELFVYRIGGLYEFEFGHYTVSPQVHYDATKDGHSVIFGVAVGFAF